MKPGSTFHGTEIRPAGHVFFIPADERPGDDPKNRPHFLVNRCDPASDLYVLGTLSHMSTKATEMVAYGCAGHEIGGSPSSTTIRHEEQFVITSRLLPRLAGDLSRSRYSATEEVRSVRRSVFRSLSIAEGAAPRVSGSVRGRLVRILDPRAGFDFGVVLTAHEYSARRRYQIVAPIIDRLIECDDGAEEIELSHWDVIPERAAWFDHVPLVEPMIETAGLLSLTEEWRQSPDPGKWLDQQIEVTPAAIDASTLAEVEAKIMERLRL